MTQTDEASSKKLILYDLDGTLVDTSQDIALAINQMLNQMGLATLSHQRVRQNIGRGVYNLVEGCLDGGGKERIEKGMSMFRSYYREHLTDNSTVYPETQSVLHYFREHQQAIITNKPEPFTSELLRDLKIRDYFSHVISGNVGYPRKPDPAGICSVMDKLKTTNNETVFVGDSVVDVQAGRSAGVLTVAIKHGYGKDKDLSDAGPDLMVEDFKEFIQCATRYGW